MEKYKHQIIAETNSTEFLIFLKKPSKGLRLGFLCLMISIMLFPLDVWASKGKSFFDQSGPLHTRLTGSIFFEYQTFENYPGPGGWTDFPASPNRWNIQVSMTNEDSEDFEIIPIFLF